MNEKDEDFLVFFLCVLRENDIFLEKYLDKPNFCITFAVVL